MWHCQGLRALCVTVWPVVALVVLAVIQMHFGDFRNTFTCLRLIATQR